MFLVLCCCVAYVSVPTGPGVDWGTTERSSPGEESVSVCFATLVAPVVTVSVGGSTNVTSRENVESGIFEIKSFFLFVEARVGKSSCFTGNA